MISQMTHAGIEQGHTMAGTFQIHHYRNSDNLHLSLMGVFDEEAAHSLMGVLNDNRPLVRKIFVHTAALDQVLDSGADLFRSGLSSLDQPGAEIIFTGKKSEDIAVNAPGIRSLR